MRLLLGLLVTLIAAPALAFEGEIEAKSIGNAASGVVEFQVYVSKKGDVRMDSLVESPDGKTHRVSHIKPAKGKYNYALDHARKQATKIPKDTLAKMTKGEPGKKGKKANVEVKKLGTDKVAGQTTRHVQVIDKDEGHTADLWLSDRYPITLWQTVFSFGGDESENPTNVWTEVVEKQYGFKPGFIMKMVSEGKDGQRGGLEVTRMQKKNVAANKFVVPPGYEVTEVPDMSGGLPSMKMPTTKEEAEKMRDEWMKKMQEQQR